MKKIRDDIYLGNNTVSLCNIGFILNEIAKYNNTFYIWWVKKPSTCVCEKLEYEVNLMWHESNSQPKPTWAEIYKVYLDLCKQRNLDP